MSSSDFDNDEDSVLEKSSWEELLRSSLLDYHDYRDAEFQMACEKTSGNERFGNHRDEAGLQNDKGDFDGVTADQLSVMSDTEYPSPFNSKSSDKALLHKPVGQRDKIIRQEKRVLSDDRSSTKESVLQGEGQWSRYQFRKKASADSNAVNPKPSTIDRKQKSVKSGSPGSKKYRYTSTRVLRPTSESIRENRLFLRKKFNRSVANQYALLKRQVLKRMVADKQNVLMVSAPRGRVGSDLTAINLAICLAKQSDYSVLLVDLDFKNPTVHQYFGVEPDLGLIDYFSRLTPLSNIMFTPSVNGLVVLPGRDSGAALGGVMASTRMIRFVQEIKSRYKNRMIICNLPPLLDSDDSVVFSFYADAILLVVGQGVTTQEEIAHTVKLIDHKPMVGTVLNTPVRNQFL